MVGGRAGGSGGEEEPRKWEACRRVGGQAGRQALGECGAELGSNGCCVQEGLLEKLGRRDELTA